MAFPYVWLADLNPPPPRVIREGCELLGTEEYVGAKHNPEILAWAKETGLEKVYTNDEIPWCGLFVAVVVKRAGFEPVSAPLWARSWAKFGNPSPQPALGDVLVFERGSGGHVGFFVAEDAEAYHVLGGNQQNKVSITRIAKSRLLAARRCPWKVAEPASVRPYVVAADGALSTNEA